MRQAVRIAALGIGGAELLLGLAFSAYLVLTSSDPLGVNIAQAIALMTLATLAVLVLPGLWLAWRNRWLPLAVALLAAGPLLWLFLMATG